MASFFFSGEFWMFSTPNTACQGVGRGRFGADSQALEAPSLFSSMFEASGGLFVGSPCRMWRAPGVVCKQGCIFPNVVMLPQALPSRQVIFCTFPFDHLSSIESDQRFSPLSRFPQTIHNHPSANVSLHRSPREAGAEPAGASTAGSSSAEHLEHEQAQVCVHARHLAAQSPHLRPHHSRYPTIRVHI